ncbi:very short patch repair endonuclease [Agrobacterium tumefaciens]|uniref:very short patch repair endonuclease n=1 Tax=Agrobacterium tumefaciens TaxID=358 RepID=UPI0015752AF2|nr:very short patch repair endonuclease [Agrobacterium tumefaciens]NTZ89288.1 DNA mismatch endonuclease Vsr [Agrobacterium tumefaciens]
MSRVRSRHTRPELFVRSALFHAGFRYRLHHSQLAGKPDIVLRRYKMAVFVHGCFWHGHHCSKGQKRPLSNVQFWEEKLDRNAQRDEENQASLENAGWSVRIVWECTLIDDTNRLLAELAAIQIALGYDRPI